MIETRTFLKTLPKWTLLLTEVHHVGINIKTELSTNGDVTTYCVAAGSRAGAIGACAQDSKEVPKKLGSTNASFDIRFSLP